MAHHSPQNAQQTCKQPLTWSRQWSNIKSLPTKKWPLSSHSSLSNLRISNTTSMYCHTLLNCVLDTDSSPAFPRKTRARNSSDVHAQLRTSVCTIHSGALNSVGGSPFDRSERCIGFGAAGQIYMGECGMVFDEPVCER